MTRRNTFTLLGCMLTAILSNQCSPSSDTGSSTGYDGEDVPVLCRDGKDNDGDGLKDCDDPDCQSLYTCDGADSDPGNDTMADSELSLDWVRITTADFTMGRNDGDPSEAPAHVVYVPHFDMLRTEVTVDQYQACVDDGGCEAVSADAYCASEEYRAIIEEDTANYPMNCVSWHQATAFCDWVGGRLPTESEWEYMASGGMKEYAYPWGNDKPSCDRAVLDDADEGGAGCGLGHVRPVCSKERGNSPAGLCDVIGNVREWVEDDVHRDYTDAPSKSIAWVESPRTEGRMVRGGAYDDGLEFSSFTRKWCDPEDGCDISVEMEGFGIRCVR